MRLVAFVNKHSGGNDGAQVLTLLRQKLGYDNVFDLRADKGPDRGLELRASDASVEVRVIVAGGDGTFSWVANAVEKRNLSHCRLAPMPLGSGNDMARALGWGNKFPGLPRIVEWLQFLKKAKAEKLDVWRLNAFEDKAVSELHNAGVVHGAKPLVCNYLSFGADAFVELRFNQLRWETPDKYKSRLGNLKTHLMLGIKYMCSAPGNKIFVNDHLEALWIDDKEVTIPRNLQAILFLNIPSYAAGSQPWGFMRKERQADVEKDRSVENMYVDDLQFEVIGLRNLRHVANIKSLGMRGVRIAQGKRMSLQLKSDTTPFQVDGEPWEQRGGEISMEAGNAVGVVKGPYWKASSKKNARFSPPVDNTVWRNFSTTEQVVESRD